jgi:hypothetical protein
VSKISLLEEPPKKPPPVKYRGSTPTRQRSVIGMPYPARKQIIADVLTSVRMHLSRVALAWIVGCSACAGSTHPGEAEIAMEELPARLAAAFCDDLGPCCSALATPYNRASCRATLEAEARDAFGYPNPPFEYDPIAARECLGAVASAIHSCQAPPRFDVGACRRIFVGTVPPGGPCSVDLDCAVAREGGAHCIVPQAPDTRFCQSAEQHAVLGEPCSETVGKFGQARSNGSGDGLACYLSDNLYCSETSHVCEPLVTLGAHCNVPHYVFGDCEAGTFCNDAQLCAPQIESGSCITNPGQVGVIGDPDACLPSTTFCDVYECRPKLKDGEACGNHGVCVSEFCGYPPPDPQGGAPLRCGIGTLERCQGHFDR